MNTVHVSTRMNTVHISLEERRTTGRHVCVSCDRHGRRLPLFGMTCTITCTYIDITYTTYISRHDIHITYIAYASTNITCPSMDMAYYSLLLGDILWSSGLDDACAHVCGPVGQIQHQHYRGVAVDTCSSDESATISIQSQQLCTPITPIYSTTMYTLNTHSTLTTGLFPLHKSRKVDMTGFP